MTQSSGTMAAQVDRITEAEWNALLDGFADANIYQTWAYGAVSWGEHQLSHLVLRRDGDPVAMAQLRIVRVPVLGSGIAYVRWGPVCTPAGSLCDPGVWQAAARAIVEEYVRRRGLTLRVLPSVFRGDAVAPAVTAGCGQLGLVEDAEARPYHTLRVDLRPPLESVRAHLAHKWRNQLNAAERNDLEVREGTSSELYAEFVALYREMMDRKPFDTTVSVTQFARIQDRLPASQKMLVLICRKDGRAMSGVVASAVGTTGQYLLGATGDDGLKAKGAYVLQWHVMRQLKERGCHWYDLGGINAEANPGVYHFKQGMGGDDATHLGSYELHGSRLSRLSIAAAERLKSLAGSIAVTRGKGSSRAQTGASR